MPLLISNKQISKGGLESALAADYKKSREGLFYFSPRGLILSEKYIRSWKAER